MEYIDSSRAGSVVNDDEVVVEPAVLVGPRQGRAKRRTFTAEFNPDPPMGGRL